MIVAYETMAVILLASPKKVLKICWMALFHASAATRPKALVIKMDNFSTISFFILPF